MGYVSWKVKYMQEAQHIIDTFIGNIGAEYIDYTISDKEVNIKWIRFMTMGAQDYVIESFRALNTKYNISNDVDWNLRRWK